MTRPNLAECKNISKVGYCPSPHLLILARQEQTKKEQVRTDKVKNARRTKKVEKNEAQYC